MPYAVLNAESAGDTNLEPLYFVHVRAAAGTYTTSCRDAAQALTAAASYRGHGYGAVRSTNAAAEALTIEDLRRLAGA